MLNYEQLLKLNAVCFLIAGIVFLIFVVLGINRTLFFILSVPVIVNSIIFITLIKRRITEKKEI